jgi:hypothetical protein
MASRWAIGLSAFLLAGCFEDPTSSDSAMAEDDTAAETSDESPTLAGVWTGSWLYEGQSGEITLQLYHTGGATVTGTATFAEVEWLQCVTQANVNGTLEEDQLTGTLVSDGDEFTFSLTVAGDQMQGTYEITAGDCGLGLSGNLGFTREP